jgi:hypothetical protein
VPIIHQLQVSERGHLVNPPLDDEPLPQAFFLALCLALIRLGKMRHLVPDNGGQRVGVDPRALPRAFQDPAVRAEIDDRKNGSDISLQDQRLEILSVLLERPGELVTREELRRRPWPADTFVDFDTSRATLRKSTLRGPWIQITEGRHWADKPR